MRKTDPSKAVGYLRVSTGDQALGLDVQREMIATFALTHRLELVAVEVDSGIGGASELEARPGLVAAL